MKEFAFDVKEELSNGLQPESSMERNSPYLSELINAKPRKHGLAPFVRPGDLVDLAGNNITENYPFPQVFVGQEVRLLCTARTIYTLDSSWTPSALTLYSPDFPTHSITPIGGGSWHFADMGNSWLLFNGTSIVFKTGISELDSTHEDVYYCENSIPIKTGCIHHGRIHFAGFNASNFWKTTWKSFWQTWIESAGDDIDDDLIHGIGDNFMFWSSIGGGDFPWFLFFPSYGVNGYIGSTYGSSNPYIFEKIRENTFGFMPTKHPGYVLSQKPMGKHVIAFGESGVSALTLSNGMYGYRMLDTFGIYSRSAVDGDDNGMLFLDEAKGLQYLKPDLQVERLGYHEYMSTLSGDILILHDSRNNEFYIGDGNKQFILTSSGLCQVYAFVTSLYHDSNELKGILLN